MTILHATLVITKLLLVFFSKFSSAGNSPNRYVGIWYKNIPVKTVVWVANRDNPIKDNSSSSKLKINSEGNLVLLNNNQSILWSTNATKTASSPIVHLLNNGNLVLRDDNENEEDSFLWQSFDYPGNTLLPGMKIGWDKKTGLNRRVTAWNNWDDPSSGYFSYSTKLTSNPEVVIWKGSDEFYRTGPMIGALSGGVFGLKPNPIYNHYFVYNSEEVYYMYTLKDNSVISIVVLNQTLLVRQRLIWIPESKTWHDYLNLPQDNCDAYNVCGTNAKCNIDGSPFCQCLDGFKPKSPQQWITTDWTQGCVRSGNWTCGVKSRDGFRRIAGVKLPDTTNSWINVNMTIDDCKVKCLQNCSCTAYSSLFPNEERKGCSIWFNDLKDLRLSQPGRDLYVRIDASDIGEHDDLELPFFNITTISDATNNFSIRNKLGEGGFGPGMLRDGQEIAVKRLSGSSLQGLKEFKNEVILCAKLQHRNLVKVIGCCIEKDEKMLVYEYMSNTGLDSFLFDPIQSKLLNWSTRFDILYGIARGLLYLHQDSRLRIIHRDLKASNILLDSGMNPKISDFGLARMCGGDQIEGQTSRIVGTYGYMAPEYAIDGLFSIKSDVFSFGVLLLELISGKRNRTLPYNRYDHNLIGHAWRLWKEGIAHTLIDDNLKDTCILNEALRCIQIGLLCLQQHPDDRPNMTSVVVMLSSNNVLPQPHEPGHGADSLVYNNMISGFLELGNLDKANEL
ncbi:G-type lectin S-receptor-like serine/threonine-protein kinase, partial [Trifolium pratense]